MKIKCLKWMSIRKYKIYKMIAKNVEFSKENIWNIQNVENIYKK